MYRKRSLPPSGFCPVLLRISFPERESSLSVFLFTVHAFYVLSTKSLLTPGPRLWFPLGLPCVLEFHFCLRICARFCVTLRVRSEVGLSVSSAWVSTSSSTLSWKAFPFPVHSLCFVKYQLTLRVWFCLAFRVSLRTAFLCLRVCRDALPLQESPTRAAAAHTSVRSSGWPRVSRGWSGSGPLLQGAWHGFDGGLVNFDTCRKSC